MYRYYHFISEPPQMEDDGRVYEVLENDTQSLECPIHDPSVDMTWLKNGVPITTSPNLQVKFFAFKTMM